MHCASLAPSRNADGKANMQSDEIIISYAGRLFQNVADIQAVASARDDRWKEQLWSGIEETGLNIAAVPEALGGAGVGLQGSLGILRVAGSMAISAPLAETMLAGWMLGAAGLRMPSGQVAFGPTTFSDRLALSGDAVTGCLTRLPFGRECAHAALLAGDSEGLSVILVALEGAAVQPRTSLAYEPVDHVTLSKQRVLATARAPKGFTRDTVLLMGSAARAMQIAGALEKVLAITTDYVTQRRAFERTISRFQSVQHAVAQLAGEVAASLSAAASAAEAIHSLLEEQRGFDDTELLLEIISAKIRTSLAAHKGAAIAHQLHGAIGVTREHVLHRLTLRALAWRDDYGNDSEWSERLGELVAARGAESLWPLLSAR